MPLDQFFRDPAHSVARERLLYSQTVFAMKLQCAKHDVQLQVTEPEIDNKGYDFSAIIGYTHLFLQHKSKISGGTNSWKIHAGVLKPDLFDVKDLDIRVDGIWLGCDGVTGGILLHIIDAAALRANDLSITYKYIDIFYIMAIAYGLWTDRKFHADEAMELLRELQASGPADRVNIRERFMLPIMSPAIPLQLRMNVPTPCLNYVQGVSMAVRQHEAATADEIPFRKLWRQGIRSIVPDAEKTRFD